MSEKMLVTQALDERDLLVKKIADKIAKASFVDTIKPNEDKVLVKRTSKEEYAKEAESAYQQITDLIDRFQKIDDRKNSQLQSTAEEMRLSILGKDSKTKDEKPLEVVETYVKENTTELVDPLDVKKKMEALEEKRNTLLTELDTQIKVSNATTFIEVA